MTKNLSSFGPTWALVNFKGPGSVNLAEINTDKITAAFAQGKAKGTPLTVVHNASNQYAYLFLQQLLTSSINSNLLYLQYSLSGLQSVLPLP